MQKLHLELQKKQVAIHSKIQTERLDMKELFIGDNPDRAAIENHMKAVSDLEYQAKLNHLGHWYDVKAILTPDQQKTWKEKFGEFWEHEGGPPQRGKMMRERIIEQMDKED
jgi:Spy/CpxP family protein refolding chaperone